MRVGCHVFGANFAVFWSTVSDSYERGSWLVRVGIGVDPLSSNYEFSSWDVLQEAMGKYIVCGELDRPMAWDISMNLLLDILIDYIGGNEVRFEICSGLWSVLSVFEVC